MSSLHVSTLFGPFGLLEAGARVGGCRRGQRRGQCGGGLYELVPSSMREVSLLLNVRSSAGSELVDFFSDIEMVIHLSCREVMSHFSAISLLRDLVSPGCGYRNAAVPSGTSTRIAISDVGLLRDLIF